MVNGYTAASLQEALEIRGRHHVIPYAGGTDLMVESKPDQQYLFLGKVPELKTITVDDEICSVGSSNLDIRSFTLNFEANALIYDSDVATEVRHIFEDDMEKSTHLTKQMYRNRSLFIKFKESISRLGSELL